MAVQKTGRPVGRPCKVPISPNEVEARKAKIAEQEQYIESLKTGKELSDGTTGMKVQNIDIGKLEKQLEREKEALKYLEPHEGTSAEKRKAQKEFNEAKEYIAEHALTRSELGKWPKPDCPEKDADYGKAVEKSMEMEVGNPKFQEMCRQLKCAAAILDPSDPELRNVNRYRKD